MVVGNKNRTCQARLQTCHLLNKVEKYLEHLKNRWINKQVDKSNDNRQRLGGAEDSQNVGKSTVEIQVRSPYKIFDMDKKIF